MKRFLLLALCALFACDAGARTLYVNAKRPNNNGNGLSAKKAKKTIQAAINIARKGDTILVYPGTYSPIKTNNLKITIKAAQGAAKTGIAKPKKASTTSWDGLALAQLGKTATTAAGPTSVTTGRKTLLFGFLLNGRNNDNEGVIGLSGGTAKACRIENVGNEDSEVYNSVRVAVNSELVACTIRKNALMYNPVFSGCSVSRCTVSENSGLSSSYAEGSVLSNTLIADNSIHSDAAPGFDSCKLYNCTVANNLFRGYKPAALPFSEKTSYFDCILWENWYQPDGLLGLANSRCNAVTAKKFKNAYKYCYTANADPGFVDADDGNYKLKKGSGCINKGKLSAAQKKLVGTKDLAGKTRIKGKAVDIGCYEY